MMVQDKDGDFQAICVLFPTLDWTKICYEDPAKKIQFKDLITDIVSDLVESWGGGKWNLKIYYSTNEGKGWSGEI